MDDPYLYTYATSTPFQEKQKRQKNFLKVTVIRYHKLHLDSSRATINFSVEEICPFETG